MNKNRLLFIILMVFLLMSSGCGVNTPKVAAPAETVPETQMTTSANPDEGDNVSIGPAIKEYYDPNQPAPKIQLVYVNTDAGINYHRIDCTKLSKGKIALGLEEAKEEGYTPCPSCKPPQ